VGHYDLTIEAAGFQTQQKTNLTVDTDAALRIDAVMQVGQRNPRRSRSPNPRTDRPDAGRHRGDASGRGVSGQTDRGAAPERPQLHGSAGDSAGRQPGHDADANSVIMAGVTGTINPSGDLNPGDVSIDGQRESANGFMVNAIDVQEHMNGGTSVIPNLDSIQEFRVLTNNFDPNTATTTAA
jgi:hypothetical protein